MERRGAFVSGALARVLQASRFAGVSAFRLVKHRDGWWISQSSFFVVYGYILATVLVVITLSTVLLDLSVTMDKSIRSSTPTRRGVWIMDAAVTSALTGYGAATAVRQGTTMISCLNNLHTINIELNTSPWQKETKASVLMCLWFLVTAWLTVADYVLLVFIIIDKHGDVLLCLMHFTYYFCYWVIQLQIFQFVMFTTHIMMTLRAIKDKLKGLATALNADRKKLRPPVMMMKKKRKKSVNSVIDSLAIPEKVKPEEYRTRSENETVRRLALTYVSVCNVVREADRRYGLWLLMLIGSSLFHLVITPYYLIYNIFPGASDFTQGTLNTVLQVSFCVYHTANLALVIEPCHQTLVEIDGIREQISHLLVLSSPSEMLSVELESFCRLLEMNRVAYSPLQVTTLTRSLVFTILGSITTYLAIVVQI